MSQHKPYKKYKPSGIPWLGDIPEYWEISKAKHILTQKKKTLNPELNCGSISFGRIVYKDNDRIPLETKATYQELLKGEFLINPLNLNFDLKSLRTGLSKIDVVVSSGYIVLKNNTNFNKNYLRWLLHQFDISFMKTLGDGVRQTLSYSDLKNTDFPYIIDKEEQAAIANFLDYKTAKIDRFIRKKKQLIKLLNEQKTAIINDAVTKGIPSKDAMHCVSTTKTKPSGIDWLDDASTGSAQGIPEHWEVRKLKYAIKDKLKYGANEPGGDLQLNDPRYIRITDFDKSGILRNDTFCSLNSELAKPYLLKAGDILFARSGGTVGKTFQFKNYEGAACYAGYLIKAEPNIKIILSDYLFQFTNSAVYENWKNFIFNKATIENIGADKYCNLPIIIPPLHEQVAIVAHIEKETAIINKTIATIEKEIALVEEYKTALIAEAVTGKIDVREYKVPEHIEEETFEDLEYTIELNEEYDDNPINTHN